MNEIQELKIKNTLARLIEDILANHGKLENYDEKLLEMTMRMKVEEAYEAINKVLHAENTI